MANKVLRKYENLEFDSQTHLKKEKKETKQKQTNKVDTVVHI